MDDRLARAYRTPEAAREYAGRHIRTPARRRTSLREARIVAELLGRPAGGKLLLDVPCGAGRHAEPFRAAGWSYLGADASADMIRAGLDARGLEKGRTMVASLFRLPLKEKCVEACACLRFLHHLSRGEHRTAALAELGRVSRGPFVASLWTGPSFQSLRRSVRRLLGGRPSQRHAVPLRLFEREAERAGLQVREIRYLYRFISETAYVRLANRAPAGGGGADRASGRRCAP